jgi:hypothetical protein
MALRVSRMIMERKEEISMAKGMDRKKETKKPKKKKQ